MSTHLYNTAAKEATSFTKQHNAAFAKHFQIDLGQHRTIAKRAKI